MSTSQWGGEEHRQYASPQAAVCILKQASDNRIRAIGAGEASCLLVEVATQALLLLPEMDFNRELRALRLKIFDSICALVRATPAYQLRLSLKGRFWEKIKEVIQMS